MDVNDEERRRMLTRMAWDAEDVRAMERPLLEGGVPLMRMAANAAAQMAARMLDDLHVDLSEARVVLLAGAGDNGGDGLFAAAALAEEGAQVTAVAVGRSLHEAGFAAFARAGGKVLVLDPAAAIPGCVRGFTSGEAARRLETAARLARGAHLVLDAMTGIGLRGGLRGVPAAVASLLGVPARDVRKGDSPLPERAAEGPLTLALDLPSGVGVDDGALSGAYLPADETVMFGAMKPCAMLPPAAFACGRVTLVDFGFDLDEAEPSVEMTDRGAAARAVREPRATDMKYNRGVVGLVTGSTRYPGAAVLTARAAARSNVGMVRYMGPERARDMVLDRLPEAVTGKGRVQSWVVGSGVPDAASDPEGEDFQRRTIAALLAHYDLSEAADDADGGRADAAMAMPPVVVDAGALDLLPQRVPHTVVLTPHAGEAARLCGVDRADVLDAPLRHARMLHERTGATVLLKGAITIVVGGRRTLAAASAPAWLGTAGAGDVLAGMAGALLAQSVAAGARTAEPDEVARVAAAAAHLHGAAAAVACESERSGWREPEPFGMTSPRPRFEAKGRPIIASDVVEAIPVAMSDALA